ncbi:MAG TPA: sodium:proton exchanger, partial [Minicystis sp.]|nr:sodium:proton exchanger [Minicystis sp.]
VLAAYLRAVGKQLVVVYVALGFGVTSVLKYLGFEALLTFMVAGFVVQNLSKQGPLLLRSIGRAGGVVYVVFFATAGADLDVPLLRRLWPVAILFVAVRGLVTLGAARASSRLAGDVPSLARWGFAGLISQAGIAIGIGEVIAAAFPSFGAGFRALCIACVALNEMIGPVLFKLALDRSGESRPESADAAAAEAQPAEPAAAHDPAAALHD